MARLFGTDGVRGLANREVTPQLAMQLGEAAARWIVTNTPDLGRKPRAIIGRDTRISGQLLDHAIAAGLASAGMDVVRVGVVTTPTVAFMTAEGDGQPFELGIMISASHNPMPDNGIKFFAKGGYKLDDEVEDQISELVGVESLPPVGEDVGWVHRVVKQAEQAYVDHLVAAVGTDLSGLKIAMDCANGAAHKLGPAALRAAGAEVEVINASPDGLNINANAGSTHPEQLQAMTVAVGADFGVAYDGDADRCLAVDHAGNLIDGDKIMGALAISMKDAGTLVDDTLVVTVMSNLGLQLAMQAAGIATVVTAVGDRYVLEAMRERGYNLGGEQSGHVIAADHATTGDGILSSMLIARMVQQSGKSLAELTAPISRLPQTLVNVSGVDRTRTDDPTLQAAVARAESELGKTGRVLLRASGTEPLVRVMVEAPNQADADRIAAELAEVVQAELAL